MRFLAAALFFFFSVNLGAQEIGRYRAAVVDVRQACSTIPEAYPRNHFLWIDTRMMRSDTTDGLVYEEGPQNVALVAATRGALLGIAEVGIRRHALLSLRYRQSPEVLVEFDLAGPPTRGVADASGTFYFLVGGGGYRGTYLVAVSRDGLRGAPVGLPDGFNYTGLDLAADQCTLYLSRYSDSSSDLLRYNVCTNTVAGTLPVPSGGDVKVLPNGDLLVAMGNRYTPSGVLVRTYALPGGSVGTLALTSNGRSFIAGYECLRADYDEIDLETGAVIALFPFSFEATRSFVLLDGWTAAVGPLAISDVPTLSTYALLAMAIFTAAVALSRFRS